jgi:integrase
MNAPTARSKADAWLSKVHDGIDPAGERAIAKKAEALTFAKIVEMYLDMQRENVRPSTLSQIALYLTKGYFAPLHNKPIAKVTRSDAAQCLGAISAKSSRLAAHKQASALFVWAMREGHAPENPFAQVARVKPGKSRERVLNDAEIRTVWSALQDDDLGRIIQLLILTGCRAAEIGGLRWSEIDTDAATITLPPERCKNGRTHTIPLSPLALGIISGIKRRGEREFVFGKFGNGFTYWSRQQGELVDTIGLAHWTIHDLRRTAATGMADLGVEPWVIEAILNHVSGHKAGMAGVYNRSKYLQQAPVALNKWAAHVERIATGKAATVVAFPKAS